jgi:DnaK suppressor protein
MSELSDAQRAAVVRRVADERARTAARIAALERDFDDIVAASADAVRDDEHDPEGPTIAFERAQVAALIEQGRAQQAALDAAARRLGEPEAGSCAGCGSPIGYERLLARPEATRCIGCAVGHRR